MRRVKRLNQPARESHFGVLSISKKSQKNLRNRFQNAGLFGCGRYLGGRSIFFSSFHETRTVEISNSNNDLFPKHNSTTSRLFALKSHHQVHYVKNEAILIALLKISTLCAIRVRVRAPRHNQKPLRPLPAPQQLTFQILASLLATRCRRVQILRPLTADFVQA